MPARYLLPPTSLLHASYLLRLPVTPHPHPPRPLLTPSPPSLPPVPSSPSLSPLSPLGPLGRQLDRAAHIEQRQASNKQFRAQLAKDMDLPSASDEEEDEDDIVSARLESKRQQEIKRLRSQLSRLLERFDRPSSGAPLHQAAAWAVAKGANRPA